MTLIGKVLGVIVICLFLYGVGLVLSGIAQLRQGHAEWKMPIIQGGLYMAGTSICGLLFYIAFQHAAPAPIF